MEAHNRRPQTSIPTRSSRLPLLYRRRRRRARQRQLPSLRTRIIWTAANFLLFAGIYLLLYVGGVQSQIAYHRLAARGDNDLPARRLVVQPEVAPARDTDAAPSFFTIPVIDPIGGESASLPSASQAAHPATISRITIPSIAVDSKVVEVGWHIEDHEGEAVAVWEVAEFAVGQHRGSANPGEDNNIVLAGHVGGYGKVFRDLFYVKPGDEVLIYSEGRQFLYVVQERLIVTEEGVSPEQRIENAGYIEPTGYEVVTLVTCWPPNGKDKFTQRVIVRALPFGADDHSPLDGPQPWSIR